MRENDLILSATTMLIYIQRLTCVSLFLVGPLFGQSYSITLLAPSNGYQSLAYAINNDAQVVGAFRQYSTPWHAFLFNGEFLDLGTLGGLQSEGLAINAAGDVVGSSDIASGGSSHAFLYHSGELLDLNDRVVSANGWTLTSAVYINNAGQIIVVGMNRNASQLFLLLPTSAGCNSETSVSTAAYCYVLSPWVGMLPSNMGASYSLPLSLGSGIGTVSVSQPLPSGSSGSVTLSFNSSGFAVGYANPHPGESRAVSFTNGATTDLNTEIRQDSGWNLLFANAVNDFGQIVGAGLYQGRTQAYLLTPLRLNTAGTNQNTGQATGTSVVSSSLTNIAGVPANLASMNESTAGGNISLDTGPAGGVLAGTYPDPTLAGITTGPVVFGNGAGTIGQNSSFTFNSSTAQLNLSDVANTYNSASLTLNKGSGSSSTLDLLESDTTGKILRIFQPNDRANLTPTLYVDNGGGVYARSWLTLSGTTNKQSGDGYNIVPPSVDPVMMGVWADVGTAIQVRTGNITGAYNYSNLDRYGNYTMSVEEDGSLKWGASTRAAMDTGLSRDSAGALELNTGTKGAFADLTLRNLTVTGAIQFPNSSNGTGAASLGNNSPAALPSRPFTWIRITLSDGSSGYIPVWK